MDTTARIAGKLAALVLSAIMLCGCMTKEYIEKTYDDTSNGRFSRLLLSPILLPGNLIVDVLEPEVGIKHEIRKENQKLKDAEEEQENQDRQTRAAQEARIDTRAETYTCRENAGGLFAYRVRPTYGYFDILNEDGSRKQTGALLIDRASGDWVGFFDERDNLDRRLGIGVSHTVQINGVAAGGPYAFIDRTRVSGADQSPEGVEFSGSCSKS